VVLVRWRCRTRSAHMSGMGLSTVDSRSHAKGDAAMLAAPPSTPASAAKPSEVDSAPMLYRRNFIFKAKFGCGSSYVGLKR
jgi:hypothetical protein